MVKQRKDLLIGGEEPASDEQVRIVVNRPKGGASRYNNQRTDENGLLTVVFRFKVMTRGVNTWLKLLQRKMQLPQPVLY